MDGYGRQVFSARTVRLLDGLLVAYVIVWTVAGVLIGIDIRRQAELSDQVTRVGSALTDIGDSLDILSAVPLVGGNIGDLAHRVLDAGRSVTASGRESRASLERMGVVVALAFTLVPLMLVLPVYLPLRLAWRREVRAVAGGPRPPPPPGGGGGGGGAGGPAPPPPPPARTSSCCSPAGRSRPCRMSACWTSAATRGRASRAAT